MPISLKVGDVIRIYDGTTDPGKMKRFLCVLVAEGWFLRINTRSRTHNGWHGRSP